MTVAYYIYGRSSYSQLISVSDLDCTDANHRKSSGHGLEAL